MFDLQGHRGARGLCPENTLPAFEQAFDLGVTSVETDVHLTQDGVPVLIHDPRINEPLCRLLPGSTSPEPARQPLLSSLSLPQLRGYAIRQREGVPLTAPAAEQFAAEHGIDPLTPPTLEEFLAFTHAYAGDLGLRTGKSAEQRARVREIGLDLELKRVPFHPEFINDAFDGTSPGVLERRVLDLVRDAGVLARTRLRSFDHRAVRAARQLEPSLTTAVLLSGTTPVNLVQVACDAGASIYCPDYQSLDAGQVRQAHEAEIRVLPYTVNDPDDWQRLVEWGVDGVTTDFPDRLADWLRARAIAF